MNRWEILCMQCAMFTLAVLHSDLICFNPINVAEKKTGDGDHLRG